MRIVHVSDTFAPIMGGIETQVARLATQQALQGHEVIVLTAAMREPARGMPRSVSSGVGTLGITGTEVELPEGLTVDPADSLPYTVIRSEWQNPFGAPVDPHAPKRFVELIGLLGPDAVHAHLGELTPVATAVLASLNDTPVPVVATVHSIWSKFPTIPLYRGAALMTGLAEAPVLWLPNSELTASRVREVVNPDLVRVLNNSVAPEDWRVQPVVHDGLVAVTATRFAPRKRVPELLEILREVGLRLGLNNAAEGAAKSPSPLRAVIAGEGPGLERAAHFLTKHGMEHWVELPGRLSRDQLVELYATSDIYLSPSIKDAFSISGLEARAAGLAILARSQSGFGAAVLDGVEGRSVPTDEQMVRVLVDWVRDEVEVRNYQQHNQSVEIPYSWKNALPAYEAAYEEAAALKKERRGR
ncbi:glycosyltransferase family 4 protein [Actinomyces minihominis]|uniref:glycosyltransferase family 4 protein n=1 Tax=Actinomyces minihominis TaxID=2002838 RepID=UPI000C07A4DE|nr:glycosyltransferase family 4 protein [Actinomyces minihominis]